MKSKHLSSAALIVAILALVTALGGTSYAAKLITGKDIKNNSVAGKDIKNNSLTGKDIKNKSLTAADLKKGTLDDKLASRRVSASSGPSYEDARSNAKEYVLYKKGPLTVYGKCFTDTSSPDTYASIYIKSSANRSVFDSDQDNADGGLVDEFLNTNTLEEDSELLYDSVSTDSATFYGNHSTEFSAAAANGTMIMGFLTVGAKNGTLAGGNGAYGPGNSCLLGAQVWNN
ncbi:hypothetical protein BH11ACT8_BH11ACT8_06260 [soil metagenome]